MNNELEDLIINTNTKVERLVDIENLLEKVANSRPEVYEMNARDREVLLGEIRRFTNELSETLRKVFVQTQEEGRKERRSLTEQNQQIFNDCMDAVQALLQDFKGCADSCKGLDTVCRNTIKSAIDMASVQREITCTIESTVKSILEKQTKANEQAAIKLGNTGKEIRKAFKNSVHITFAIPAMVLLLFSYISGIGTHSLWVKNNCKDVFEKFYSDKYEAEITEPLKQAQAEAQLYLKQQKSEADKYLSDTKKQADEDLKIKKGEAAKYLKEQMEEARKKASEEFNRRMELYSQQVQNSVEKNIKNQKSKTKEEK